MSSFVISALKLFEIQNDWWGKSMENTFTPKIVRVLVEDFVFSALPTCLCA